MLWFSFRNGMGKGNTVTRKVGDGKLMVKCMMEMLPVLRFMKKQKKNSIVTFDGT